MAKQARQTSKRLRAAEDRDKAQSTRAVPLRIDLDRGLARGLIGLIFAIVSFLALNLDVVRQDPDQLLIDRMPLGIAILVSASMILIASYLYAHARRLVNSKTKLFVLGLLWSVPLIVARAIALSDPSASIASANIVPLGAAVFIIALCHGSQVAITLAFVLSVLVAVALRNASFPVMHPAAIPLLGGALIWAFGARRIRKRLWLFNVGLIVAVVQLWLIIGIELLTQPKISNAGLWGAANGIITGAVLTALLPIIEYLFGVNTEISLLELSDLNQPLMRQLGLQAPGTYHHSLIVGSLAETASEALGADPLLARVGAYFHDIGKLQKPDYFVENEGAQGSRHDQLSPSMSALIIGAHVKDGSEMAEEYNLPRAIIDIIEQHHGTSLMEFFYYRSKESNDPEEELTSEALFRYPGPRPRTREAAIIMLADAVEAASRTLPEPSPARLQALVHDLTMKKLLDNQLDECPITLTDLAKAEKSFVRVLAAIFHSRVKYPEAASTASTVVRSPNHTPNGERASNA
jgi:cyclic-di-AMP phosphodiesterase PgpH